jgi:hypothetical protein
MEPTADSGQAWADVGPVGVLSMVAQVKARKSGCTVAGTAGFGIGVEMSGWVSAGIAGIALLVSVLTALATWLRYRRESRTANLTAYFRWNREVSRVDPPDRRIHVGYNLVIWNQGPATASNIELEVRRPGGEAVRLASRS